MIISIGIFSTLKGKLLMSKRIIAVNWEIVLSFPKGLAAIVTPSEAAITLKPVMVNSLAIITTTTHAGILFIPTSEIRAAATKILSARGSANFPKLVTRFLLLARYPSSVSVRDAIVNIMAAI